MTTHPFSEADLEQPETDWLAMTSLLEPDDSVDDPFAALEQTRDAWRNKAREAPWSADRMPALDLTDVDWHEYGPPEMLKETPAVMPQILLDIVAASIDNVKTRIAEEDRQRRATEEQRSATEAEAARHVNDEGSGPYPPGIIVSNDAPADAANDALSHTATESSRVDISVPEETVPTKSTTTLAVKFEKRLKFALRGLFQRSMEKGESSSAGAARETLRQKLEAKLDDVETSAANPNSRKLIRKLCKSGFSKPADPSKLLECVSCLDDALPKNCVKVACHSYCRQCFVRLVTAAVQNEQQWPPKCCLNHIPSRLILSNIPGDLQTSFQERASEWEIPVSERVYCHQPQCTLWIKPRDIDLSKRQGRCKRGHLTCTLCRGPHHGRADCPMDRDMDLTNALAEEEGWRRCSRCRALVEHKEACQHMTCRCGNEFCYVCGRKWRSCSCTMAHLDELKDAAQQRRDQRRLREQAENEELWDILAQIEAFEREEATKADLERLEQARMTEERWHLELEELTRQECARRKEVELKYDELRTRLDELHELQQTLVDSQQKEDAADLMEESRAQKEKLAEKQDAELADLDVSILSKMASKEQCFDRDYAIRAAQERKVEQDYHHQLQAFWAGKPGCGEEIEAAMLPLRKRMDQGHLAWQKWKSEQLALCRSRLDDQRTIRAELMYGAAQHLAGLYESKEIDLKRKTVAEKKWVQEVILERERLLGAQEVLEMEGDADSLFRQDTDDGDGH